MRIKFTRLATLLVFALLLQATFVAPAANYLGSNRRSGNRCIRLDQSHAVFPGRVQVNWLSLKQAQVEQTKAPARRLSHLPLVRTLEQVGECCCYQQQLSTLLRSNCPLRNQLRVKWWESQTSHISAIPCTP